MLVRTLDPAQTEWVTSAMGKVHAKRKREKKGLPLEKVKSSIYLFCVLFNSNKTFKPFGRKGVNEEGRTHRTLTLRPSAGLF